LRGFASDLKGLREELGALAGDGEPQAAARQLHTLKGLAATLGARALAAAASRAETAQGGEPNEAHAALANLDQAFERSMDDIAWLAANLDAPAPGPLDPADGGPPTTPQALTSALHELAGLLGNADMRAMDVHARLTRSHAAVLGPRLAALDGAVAAFDFKAAQAQCHVLLEHLGHAT
uniref:Hpt domain-containing protein n=1 Tax=Methylibium sp. TaxID=2067992 RepID=UPI001856B084